VVDQVNTSTPQIYMVHTDHLDRPVLMISTAGAWVWNAIYDPFGKVSYLWSSSEIMDIRFPGQWFQLETGLAYNWHRHYDPSLGRYIQPDPLGLQTLLSDGPSAYGYAGGNPLAYADISGLTTYICHRRAHLPFPFNYTNHYWIKTDKFEAGMGATCQIPGQNCSDMPYSSTQTKDHSGESSQAGAVCEEQRNVDEDCINTRIAPGQATGTWQPLNQCQSWTYGTIQACRYGMQEGPILPNPLK
jgi:RHS repeat-associated protein